MIQFAKEAHSGEIKKLWKECFGDEERYVAQYLEHYLENETILIDIEGGETAGMLSLLPSELVTERGVQPVRYIYAVAALPSRQGQGVGSRLLAAAAEWLEQRRESGILVPASSSLFDYYKKRGFSKGFFVTEITGILGVFEEGREAGVLAAEFSSRHAKRLEEITGISSLQDADASEYWELRNKCFYRPGYLVWGESEIWYVLKETALTNGFCKTFLYDGKQYGVIGRKKDHCLIITEITAIGMEAIVLSASLASFYGCNSFTLRQCPENEERAGQIVYDVRQLKTKPPFLISMQKIVRPFALSLPSFAAEHVYLNLVLD